MPEPGARPALLKACAREHKRLLEEAVDSIVFAMETDKVTRAALAKKLGCSASAVSARLNVRKRRSVSLMTLTEMAYALGWRLKISIERRRDRLGLGPVCPCGEPTMQAVVQTRTVHPAGMQRTRAESTGVVTYQCAVGHWHTDGHIVPGPPPDVTIKVGL